jgi:outer membrane protein TolC
MVSIPLPLVDPGAFEAARAHGEATVELTRGEEVALLLERETRVALHEREHAREVRDALQSMAIEPGRRALDEILRRYGAGAVGITETLAARRELLMVEESYLASCADVHRVDIRLEHAVGGALPRKEAR